MTIGSIGRDQRQLMGEYHRLQDRVKMLEVKDNGEIDALSLRYDARFRRLGVWVLASWLIGICGIVVAYWK